MAPRRPLPRVGALIAALAVTTVACSGTGGEGVEICAERGTATVCLRSNNGGPFRMAGEGFEPRSSVGVDIATGAGTMVAVDEQGRIPRSEGVPGFFPGPDTRTHLLEGTDGSGVPVSFLITCSLSDAKRPLCRF
ncbi:MAG: hypothetical protein ACLGI2_14235 [Acidimicrobiia bacterium]